MFYFLSRIIKPFFQFCREDPVIKGAFFILSRITKIFIFSILQTTPSIFKELFLLGRMKKKIFISSNLQRRPRIFII